MKKLLTVLLTLLMVFTLVGCSDKKEEEPVIVDTLEVNEVEVEDEPIVGGFVEVEDRTLTDELKEIFNKAKEGYVGMSLEPIELYQTQVVAGTNYKFVCSGTKTTNPPINGSYFVTVYKDLQGNCSIIDVETITESSGDVDGEPAVKEVDKTINYWVVFYNPDGNELQRSAIKYGTVPTFDGGTPQYWDEDYWYKFVCWTDKQGNEIKEFKPITGNTYIYAKYEMGGEHRKVEESTPTPSHVCAKISTYLLNVLDVPSQFEAKVSVYEWDSSENCYKLTGANVSMDTLKFSGMLDSSDIGSWIHTNNSNYPAIGNQQTCDDYEAHTINNGECLAKGTMITMADGSREPIENLNIGDLVRVFNHDTGEVSNAKVMDYWQYEKKKSGSIILHFTNNINVNIVTAHSFYNKEENKYVLLDAFSINKYIGKHFYNVDSDSWEKLLSATYSDEKVDAFFMATEGQFNTVAEGMLNVEDDVYFVLRNTFDFDKNMKVDEVKKANDILRYGLFKNSDFEYLTEEAFERYDAAYLKVALGKGIITEDYLDILRADSITYESNNIVEEFIPENIQHSVK